MQIKEKVMVITGGSSGIGKATADVFSAKGFVVYELSRHGEDRGAVNHIACDVTDADQIQAALEKIWAACGRIDVILSNAGYGIAGSVEFTTLEDLHRQFDVNWFGAVRFIQLAIPYLRRSGGGRIGITSSVAAVTPIPFQTFYTCTKAALNALVLGLNNELKPFHIQVFALMPGDTKTGFTGQRQTSTQAEEAAVYGGVIQKSIAKMAADEAKGGSVLPLARCLYRLCTQKRKPKPLRGFGAGYRFLLFLAKLLPARLMNWVLYHLYAKSD